MAEIGVQPGRGLVGSVPLPGDKSISHRLALLGAIAEGTTEITGFSAGEDCRSTLACLQKLGVPVETREEKGGGLRVRVEGRGLGGLQPPSEPLDAGNSGTTLRLLAGILAAHPFQSILSGDESLQRRPMRRIIEPLERMGARLHAREKEFPPLEIRGGPLRAIEYKLPVASAQVKSAVLLAGLHAGGTTVVEEPIRTRDHTEVALVEFGAMVHRRRTRVEIVGEARLNGGRFSVPGDFSAAAFFLVAAALLPQSNLMIPDVGLNPTRAALLDFLVSQGADIRVLDVAEERGELRGKLVVRGGRPLAGGEIAGSLTVQLMDELPALAVLGTRTERGLLIRNAEELRRKETDRVRALAVNLRTMGAEVEEFPDGLRVAGGQTLRGAEVESFGDHRIAMAMAIAGLAAEGETSIRNGDCAAVSVPRFFEVLGAVRE